MMLNTPDQQHVDSDAFTFANQHRTDTFGVHYRRSDIVAAAERTSDSLPRDGANDDRERAVIWRFSSQVFRLLGLEAKIA